MNVPRVSAEEAQSKVSSGEAFLVCAYDSDEKFTHNHLGGAISLREFNEILVTVPKAKEIIFYCA